MRADRGRARLIACGLVLALGQAGMLALAPALAGEARIVPAAAFGFVGCALAAGLAWFLGIGPGLRLAPRPGVLAALLAIGVAMRLAWFGTLPVLDTDWLRYLWDGGLAAQGISPWGPPPAARGDLLPGLGEDAAALHATLPFAHLRTIYPATAQAAFLLAHWVAPWELVGLRLLMLGAELATLALLVLVLRRMGLPVLRAAIWWCCPLLPVLLVGAAHVDALIPPLLLAALLATLAGRGGVAGALLGLAAGVKVWPLLLAPLLGRWLPGGGARLRGALALGLVGAAVLAPLAATVLAPDAGLAAYASGWAVNNAPFAWARGLLGAEAAREVLRPVLALAAGLVALAVAAPAPAAREAPPAPAAPNAPAPAAPEAPAPAAPEALARGALILAAAVFYLSPAQYPWYAAWFLPFATLLACRALLLPAALLPLYWLWFPMRDLGLLPLHNHAVAALHLLVPLAFLAWGRRR